MLMSCLAFLDDMQFINSMCCNGVYYNFCNDGIDLHYHGSPSSSPYNNAYRQRVKCVNYIVVHNVLKF